MTMPQWMENVLAGKSLPNESWLQAQSEALSQRASGDPRGGVTAEELGLTNEEWAAIYKGFDPDRDTYDRQYEIQSAAVRAVVAVRSAQRIGFGGRFLKSWGSGMDHMVGITCDTGDFTVVWRERYLHESQRYCFQSKLIFGSIEDVIFALPNNSEGFCEFSEGKQVRTDVLALQEREIELQKAVNAAYELLAKYKRP